MAKSINIVSDTTYASKAHGVHTAFLQHTRFCKEVLGLDVKINDWFAKSDIDHHHTIGFYYWLFKLIHPRRQHILHGHVIFDSLIGSIKLPGFTKQLASGYLRLAYKLADQIVAVSDEVKNDLVKAGIEAEKIIVIKNLVLPVSNNDKFSRQQAKNQIGLKSQRNMVLSVGQIQPRKRFDLFCRLADQLPNVDFVWVGDTVFRSLGEGTDDMDKLKQASPQNLKLAGIIDYDKTAVYYQAADVFILLSDQENHPMAVLEAMNFKVPVMLREVAFAKQNFKSTALLTKDDEIKESLKKLLTDEKLQKQLINSAQTYLKDDIIGQAKQSYIKLYDKIL